MEVVKKAAQGVGSGKRDYGEECADKKVIGERELDAEQWEDEALRGDGNPVSDQDIKDGLNE